MDEILLLINEVNNAEKTIGRTTDNIIATIRKIKIIEIFTNSVLQQETTKCTLRCIKPTLLWSNSIEYIINSNFITLTTM